MLSLRMTVAMMSRITISLKSSVEDMKNVDVVRPVLPSMFTQHSRMDVASNIKIVAPGYNQTKTVDSLDFGLEMPINGLRRNQPNSGTPNMTGLGSGPTSILTPNRRLLSTIPQEFDWEHSASLSTTSPRGSNSTARHVEYSTTEKPRGA